MVGYIIGYKYEDRDNGTPDFIGGAVKPIQDTDFVECTYKNNTSDVKGNYEEGKFQRHSFEVTIDESFKYKTIQLFNYHKKPITEIVKVQNIEYLDLPCKTKVYV